jgi:glutathione synthase
VNSPTEVRNLPEKLFICNYPELMPPTAVTQDFEVVQEFLSEHKQIILKPLYAFGGADVFLATDHESAKKSFDHIIDKYNVALVVQKFLPEVKLGDKRIILINGKIAGAVNRIPAQESIKSNLAAGGTAIKTTITPAEHKICEIIGAELKSRGIIIAGLDLIGDYITEVNVTCPTTFNAMNNLYQLQGKERIESLAWDAILSSKNLN